MPDPISSFGARRVASFRGLGLSQRGVGGEAFSVELTDPTATVLNETSAELVVTTTVGTGDLYVVVTQSATVPSNAQIIAGQDHTGTAANFAHDQGVGVSGIQTIFGNATGLTESLTYYAHFLQVVGSETSQASTGAFVPADVSAPILTSFDALKNGTDAWTGTLNTDTAEGELDVVITTSATTPTATQIKAGQDHTGATAASRVENQAVTTTGPQAVSGSGLSDDTTYWAHATQTDVALNEADAITSSSSFTTDSATILFQAYNDGVVTGSLLSATMTGSQADSDGGTNAVLLSNTGSNAQVLNLVTYNDGINEVEVKVKVITVGASITLPLIVRLRPINVTTTVARAYDLTNGTVSAGGSDASITDIGDGWFRLWARWDMTGDADIDGTIVFWILEDTAVADDVQIALHDLTVSIGV